VAEHSMRPATAARMRELLAAQTPEKASVWADEYRHDHREADPWPCIDIYLADSRIDLGSAHPNKSSWVRGESEVHWLSRLRDYRKQLRASPIG
jgi:hypothetical protein